MPRYKKQASGFERRRRQRKRAQPAPVEEALGTQVPKDRTEICPQAKDDLSLDTEGLNVNGNNAQSSRDSTSDSGSCDSNSTPSTSVTSPTASISTLELTALEETMSLTTLEDPTEVFLQVEENPRSHTAGLTVNGTNPRSSRRNNLRSAGRDADSARSIPIISSTAPVSTPVLVPLVYPKRSDIKIRLPPTFYAIRGSPGKGSGVFAVRNISRGTRILAEEPFFSVKKPANGLNVLNAMRRVPSEVRDRVLQLHDPSYSEFPRTLRIVWANSFDTGARDSIFLQATNINHSCIPNCHYSWNTLLDRLTVHAVKDIPDGQEITISYTNPLRTRRQRQMQLIPNWNFVCSCLACQPHTPFGRASEARRRRMFAIDQQLAHYTSHPGTAKEMFSHADMLPAVLELVDLLLAEGVVHGELWRAYDDAVRLYNARGSAAQALVYAGKKLEVQLYCVGMDSLIVMETLQEMNRLSRTKGLLILPKR